MSSCNMKAPDSDEEVDLEALRLAALKSRKPKYPLVNHNNLIPIVPVAVEPKDFVNTKIKVERASPTQEKNSDENIEEKVKKENKENEVEKVSNMLEAFLETDQDILSMDDKEEEDSLERLMDQLEAEISGKGTTASTKSGAQSKKDVNGNKNGEEDEIELVQIKNLKEPGAIIEIRESASPEHISKERNLRNSFSPKPLRRRSRSRLRSRSRSPFYRNYRRSRSPYWSRSPRRSRSPNRRSRSPFRRRSRSFSRSPLRKGKSPDWRHSPYSRFSRSRSRSFDRRRSPWSLSPRKRSKSPLYRRRNFNSPVRSRRSFTPRDGSKSPRSRSPRRFARNSPFRRSKSPYRRSKSPIRRTPPRRSPSPYLRRSKTPVKSPNRSPLGKDRNPDYPNRRSSPKSLDRPSSTFRSKSFVKKDNLPRRSPARFKDDRNYSFSMSPSPPRKNRSPLRAVEKNKLEGNDKSGPPRDRSRNEKRHRSLSRENNRRMPRSKQFRRYSPSRNRRSADRQTKNSRSPKSKTTPEKNNEATKPVEKAPTPEPAAPTDPVLEARKKKFETLAEVDPTVDKKISLKSIKESTEAADDDDDDALTINIEGNLWDESEESEDESESRFKSGDAKKTRPNRTVLSFRNLREGDNPSRKINLNKPLTDETRRGREKFGRNDRGDRWQQGSRRNERNDRRRNRSSEVSRSNEKVNPQTRSVESEPRRPDRKPIVWSKRDEKKVVTNSKESEVTTTQTDVQTKNKTSDKGLREDRNKTGKCDSEIKETDDFDKFISEFEKELQSDICISTKDESIVGDADSSEVNKPKMSVKKDLIQPKSLVESTVTKKPPHRLVRISEASSNKFDRISKFENANILVEEKKVEVEEQPATDGPEDYEEDDDFELEVSAGRKWTPKEDEEDNQSDLRAVLSRRRNERLKKAVSLQENMPTRLVQSAFQGLGNKKPRRQIKEVQATLDLTPFDRSTKTTGAEGRRVLLLQREKNPLVSSVKRIVPEVKPDTTINQRFMRSGGRKQRKLQRQLDSVEDLMDQEDEEEGFEIEEERQTRRFRLKRNITLSSQEYKHRMRSKLEPRRVAPNFKMFV